MLVMRVTLEKAEPDDPLLMGVTSPQVQLSA